MACKSLERHFYQIAVYFLIIRISLRNFAENYDYDMKWRNSSISAG